jgi:hypothetical protein
LEDFVPGAMPRDRKIEDRKIRIGPIFLSSISLSLGFCLFYVLPQLILGP